MSLDNKEKALLEFISKFDTVMVALSGGLDSSTVLWASIKALGPDKVWAATSSSYSLPAGEKEEALRIAKEVGLKEDHHIIVATSEMDNPNYAENSVERCYFCKRELYTMLSTITQAKKIGVIFDGANVSDIGDFRPGYRAAQEKGVVSPLMEAGFIKEEVRELARKYDLSFSEKPAAACLASRIPYGTRVTPERLTLVDNAEQAVRDLGFFGIRIRFHGPVARLEVREEDIGRIFSDGIRDKLVAGIKNAGFKYVALDLEGYRTGSLNAEITAERKSDG